MIIETDFCDHWKVESIVNSCGECAVRAILRLWAFCQMRKTDVVSAAQLEAIAKWKGEKGLFIESLQQAELIEPTDNEKYVRMHDFSTVNAKIYSRWQNGKNGGRNANRTETEQEPNDNQDETEQEPNGNRAQTENPIGGKKQNRTKTEGKPNDPQIDKTDKTDKRKDKKKNSSVQNCVDMFSATLRGYVGVGQKAITESDCEAIIAKFAEWTKYRFETIGKPFMVASAALHAKRAAKCMFEHMLTAEQVCAEFDRSMEHEWEGWFFEEQIAKIKASRDAEKFAKNQPRLAPVGVPQGAMNYDQA